MCDVTNPRARYRWRHAQGPGGTTYAVMERVPDLPRVTEYLLDAIVFVYPDEDEARRGEPHGGTGCLVSYPFVTEGYEDKIHLYAVTNSHVVKRDGRSRALRMNKIDGEVEVITTPGSAWHHHDDADVAAVPLHVDQKAIRLSDIPAEIFLTPEDVAGQFYVDGDDCMFIGRHHGLDGKQRNTPAVRMGSVAIMTPEPVDRTDTHGRHEESIALEARSLSGFSGSPVFVWQSGQIAAPRYGSGLIGSERSLIGKWPIVVHGTLESRFAFLGITWGHMKGPNAVVDPGDDEDDAEKALTLNSGIMLAVPAWRIKELLDSEELAAMREEAEKQAVQEAKEREARSPAAEDSSEPDEDPGRLSLHPLAPEDALRAMLHTKPERTQD